MSGNNSGNATTSAVQAASSLALLLREDPLLQKLDMHVGGGDEPAFAYAAAVLETDSNDSTSHRLKAEEALGEVDRKLALVESLAERVSRTSPEAVAAPLLRLHGFSVEESEDPSQPTPSNTILATRERCDRLKRQGDVLDSVASRVESSLTRGYNRMDKATKRLTRVLQLSETLKMIMRLHFEASKLESYYLDDLRDLTRAAASVAVIEDLLSKPELKDGPKIDVVETVRPQTKKTAAAVRKAAAELLAQYQTTSTSPSAVVQLGATFQVYFHLGELPTAAWTAVDKALTAAENATSTFLSPTTLANLTESATTEAKLSTTGTSKKLSDASVQRTLKTKLKELRAEVAERWARQIADTSLQVWSLHQVLSRKMDPVSRQLFLSVVANAPVPPGFSPYVSPTQTKETFSVFAIYWEKFCHKVGDRLKHILDYENGKFGEDVAGLYPAVRVACIKMLATLTDSMQAGLGTVTLEDTTTSSSSGLLGGSSALNDTFLQWTTVDEATQSTNHGATSADTWTVASNDNAPDRFGTSSGTTSMSVVFNSPEWQALQGNHASGKGLFRLQRAFLEASSERLCAPLQFMFQENVSVDDHGTALSHLPLLPSRYDIQMLDNNMRQELALADPREGGGDLSAVSMLAENVVRMVSKFCEQARHGVSHAGEDACIDAQGRPTEALLHDIKVTKIMNAMSDVLQQAPKKVFVEPYRPAVTPKQEEAASLCSQALQPCIQEIDKLVFSNVLASLCRALNRRIATEIAKIHHDRTLQQEMQVASVDDATSSFVQDHLEGLFAQISSEHLSKLPKKYASTVAQTVASFSMYNFVSNMMLIRPMTESTRMKLTQNLSDFEMVLTELMLKCGPGKLGEINNGKPYAELRAISNILFWTGLEDTTKEPTTVSKTLLREAWARHIRPSTILHFLFAFAPTLLSSPHHMKRMRVDEYVGTLVSLDGDVEEGEASTWMTIMSCCDTYHQRESAKQGASDGDTRIPAILMSLGPELLRRRRP
eukprot:Nitzschia sp. Nitz4//scaffold50_size126154//93439//96441//NITZ4_003696-RA/size126154-processed-gene-0.154-mRNA-1//1//CDS//3329553731//5042//frame0